MTGEMNSGDAGNASNDETAGAAASVTSDVTAADMTTDTDTVPDAAAPRQVKQRRRRGLIVLAVLAIIAGVAGSWTYNRGAPTRQDRSAAIIRAAIDPSTYVTPGNYNDVTVPIRNDGPYAVTVTGLYLPTAPKIFWDGTWTVIQPGQTANLRVDAPFACPAIPHTLKHTAAVPVLLRVQTIDGGSHASLRTSISGMIQYAADYCITPTPTKKKA
jgi:hypothetical protein